MTDETMDELSILKLDCPKCGQENNIKSSVTIRCGECEEDLTQDVYKKRPWAFKSVAVLLLGALGWTEAKEWMDIDNRYPLKYEYEVVNSCLNSYEKPVSRNVYNQKSELCVCALGMTQKSMNYDEVKEEPKEFLRKYELNFDTCLDES